MIERDDAEQVGAGGGEMGLLAELLEQGDAGVLLELPDLARDRRLRQVQLFGGAREAQVPGDRREHLELAQRRVLHPMLSAASAPLRRRRTLSIAAARKPLS